MTPTHRSHDMTDKLREALAFYADDANWRQNGPLDPNSADFTGGPARAALAAAPQPASSCPCPQHGDETYYAKGKTAEWWVGLTDEQFAWELTCAAQDLNDTGLGDDLDKWMPHQVMLADAAKRIKRLSAAPQPAKKQTMCERCDGSGYEWAVGNCPKCEGSGWVSSAPQPALDREALVEVIDNALYEWSQKQDASDAAYVADALLARGLRLPAPETMAWAAKIILSQPKRPGSPVADAFTVACAHLEDRECGAETTNEIIETFLKALAGEDN